MSAFFLLYALTIAIELVLSLVMALFLFLIMAPVGGRQPHHEPQAPSRELARTVEGALGDAFACLAEGRDDLATLTNARALLVRHAADVASSAMRDRRA